MTRSLTVPGDGPNRPQFARWIPTADVPVYPVVSGSTFRLGGGRPYPAVTNVGPVVPAAMGRYAIALAMREIGLSEGDRVLVPAYHCDTMVAPIANLSAQPVFYQIKDDLSVDLDDLRAKIDARIRVVVAAHYFGFHQDVAALREICDQRDIVLLEDCAHAFFGEIDGRPIGSYGDYAIASFWKFFPVAGGGCLTSATRPLDTIALRAPGVFANARGVLDLMDRSDYYGRLWPLRPVHAAFGLARRLRTLVAPRDVNDETGVGNAGANDMSSAFDPVLAENAMLNISRTISQLLARRGGAIAEQRRRNYRALVDNLAAVPGCRPVRPELPDGVVPFMVPLSIDRLDDIFPYLEDAALPMQRFGQFLWPGVDRTTCPVSARHSHRMIQIPCHQDLMKDELAWMVETIRNVLARRSSRSQ